MTVLYFKLSVLREKKSQPKIHLFPLKTWVYLKGSETRRERRETWQEHETPLLQDWLVASSKVCVYVSLLFYVAPRNIIKLFYFIIHTNKLLLKDSIDVFWFTIWLFFPHLSYLRSTLKLFGHEAIKRGNTILTWGSTIFFFQNMFFLSRFLRKWVTSTWTRWWTRHRVPSTSPCSSLSSAKDSRLVFKTRVQFHRHF